MPWESTGSTSATTCVSQPDIFCNFDNCYMFMESLVGSSEERPEMLLNILHALPPAPSTHTTGNENISSAQVRI